MSQSTKFRRRLVLLAGLAALSTAAWMSERQGCYACAMADGISSGACNLEKEPHTEKSATERPKTVSAGETQRLPSPMRR